MFVEYSEIHGNFYGTHQGKINDIINRGKICLMDIDIQGGKQVHKTLSNSNFLFIDAPNLEVLEERLVRRGNEEAEVIEKRMKNSKEELEEVEKLEFYEHLMNDNLIETKQLMWEYIQKKYEVKL